jgi:hypothetical protein
MYNRHVGRLFLIAVVCLVGCEFRLEPAAGQFTCPDGLCPLGFACVAGECVGGSDGDGGITRADGGPVDGDGGVPDTCGNGFLDEFEECDLGEDNGDDRRCLASCRWASCGDGKVRTGVEECEQSVSGDRCTASCLLCPPPNNVSVEDTCLSLTSPETFITNWVFGVQVANRRTVSITSDAINQAVGQVVGASGNDAPVWIGVWAPNIWSDSQPLVYTAWAAGQPTTTPGMNVALTLANNGAITWSTIDPNTVLRAVYQRVGKIYYQGDGRVFSRFFAGFDNPHAPLMCSQLAKLDSPELMTFLAARLRPDSYCAQTEAGGGCRVMYNDGTTFSQVSPDCPADGFCSPICEEE